MTATRSLEDWIAFARVDAERRGLPELKPLLGGLEAALRELRDADWNDDFGAEAATPAASATDDASPPTPTPTPTPIPPTTRSRA